MRRRRSLAAEVVPLEDRALMAVTAITATATPKVLPNLQGGRFVPVVISGTISQAVSTTLGNLTSPPPPEELAAIDAGNTKKPAPVAIGIVTDQFRTVEPRYRMQLGEPTEFGNLFGPAKPDNPHAIEYQFRNYDYSFTIYLKAQTTSIDRQYTITAAAADSDNAAQTTIGVVVPARPFAPRGRGRAGARR